MSLEEPLDIDLDGCRECLGIAESKCTLICFVWFGLLDSWDIKLVNGLTNGGKDAVVALVNQRLELSLVLALESTR